MKKAPQDQRPIRGCDNHAITERNYSGSIPISVIEKLEDEMQDIDFGGISLIIAIRDGHATFRIEKTVSIMPGCQ